MDPISPELVLVDPDLARRARARLPDVRARNGAVRLARAQATVRAVPRRPVVGAGAVALPVAPTVPPPLVLFRAAAAEVETEVEPRRALGQKLLLVAAGLFVFLLGTLIPPLVGG
jgi:hypothetical protein